MPGRNQIQINVLMARWAVRWRSRLKHVWRSRLYIHKAISLLLEGGSMFIRLVIYRVVRLYW